jgi:phosphatidylglycerophosphatase A
MGQLGRRVLEGIVSFFWTGFISKKMPGTTGSAAACAVALAFRSSYASLFALFFISLFIGLFACHAYIVKYEYETDNDPGYVVIDEACGIFFGIAVIALIYGSASYTDVVSYFTLFRAFDIFKPQPIRWVEKTLGGNRNTLSLGIMVDDVLAAFMSVLSFVVMKGLLSCA